MSEPQKPVAQQSAFERWEVVEPVSDAESDDARAARLLVESTRIREQARAEGMLQGIEDGRREAQADCLRMKDLAVSFTQALESLDFKIADMVLDLALDVARQVVAGELAAKPERVMDVVRLALRQMMDTTREARLLLNPEDAALVRPQLEEVLDESRLRIVEDSRIVRGGCLIETPHGDLDATLQMRWRQVVKVLGSNKNWLE
ncbi:MAG TPA: FliH/SctL family protein [Thiobacillaceae bacterium]|nr:FliH/SctL family protein [Thiobacillaceae bacterium]